MRYITTIFFILISLSVFSQEQKEPLRNEVKINPINLLFNPPWISLSYERVINQESSFGSNVLFITDSGESLFGVTPYYRLFFGKKPAAGFFIEGSGLILGGSGSDDVVFGGAIAIGVKVLSKKNIVLDIYAGLGRWSETNIISGAAYPRFGLNIGKRF